jgi:hypothetical protein
MMGMVLTTHAGLLDATRLHVAGRGQQVRVLDVAVLLAMGVVTASLASFVKLRLGIPGHAIILSVLPISVGLALVPRYGAGTLMSLTAAMAMMAYREMALPVGGGPGAVTSMLAAGLAANLVALIARGGFKFLSFQPLVGKPFSEWFRYAVVTYPLAGAVAGLVCALMLFRVTSRRTAG